MRLRNGDAAGWDTTVIGVGAAGAVDNIGGRGAALGEVRIYDLSQDPNFVIPNQRPFQRGPGSQIPARIG